METDSMTQTELASYLETLAKLVEATAKDAQDAARPGGHEGKQKAPATACNSDQGKENPRTTTNQGAPLLYHGRARNTRREL